MRFKFLLVTLFICSIALSQNKGTVTGIISDKDLNNEPLAFANVMIKGTTNGVSTDVEGKYLINVEAGSYVLVISFLGYQSVEVPFTIKADEKITISKTIGSGSVSLDDIVVKTTVNRQKETALLLEQKNAVEIKQAIGAQELSRKGVSDAAGAVAKTTGVSRQEGVKNVFVRGLGDRYNSTMLNGLPLPSEDPEYKNIALEFFSTDIIKNINVNKTFNATLYGDVAGANIDIASKDLDQSSVFSITAETGFNSNALNGNFLVADGQNYFGRLENGKNVPISNLSDYGFETSYNPSSKGSTLNNDFSIVGGKKFNVGEGKSLSLFGVVLSNTSYEFKEGSIGAFTSQGNAVRDLSFKKYDYAATQAGLASIKYKFGSGKSITYNGLYIHDNGQSVGDYNGFTTTVDDNEENDKSFIRRQQVNNNNLFSNQLLVDYKLSDKWDVNLGGSFSTIDGSEPDRRTNSATFDSVSNTYFVATNSPALNNRFFSILNEDDIAGKFEIAYTFNPDADLVKKLSFGANYRNTDRRFDYTILNFDAAGNNPIDINNPDRFFNQTNLDLGRDNGGFNIVTGRGTQPNTAFDPFYYKGKREILAGYAQMVYPISEKLTLQGGVRYEKIDQIVEWDTNISSSVNGLTTDPSIINKNYVLPSITAKYSFTDKNTVRFAASQTYTYPQFKETAPFLYEDVNFSSFGNPKLLPSENLNFDLKYDFYLSKKEIISFGTFYKQIKNPINRIRVASAANELSYVNLGDAFATGFEIEARKSIIDIQSGDNTTNLAFGLNLSYLYTDVKVIDVTTDDLTILPSNPESKLEGASPLLINSDISYSFSNERHSLTSSLVFNYFYDKVYSIGTSLTQNIIEKSVPTVDFVNKFEFIKNKLGIKLSFKNILNPDFKLTQETQNNNIITESEVSSYKKGFFGSFGIFWNL